MKIQLTELPVGSEFRLAGRPWTVKQVEGSHLPPLKLNCESTGNSFSRIFINFLLVKCTAARNHAGRPAEKAVTHASDNDATSFTRGR